MARIRTIKPEFWKHEGLSELPEATHMLAAALLNYADDEGYFNANPSLIQAECFPLRELSETIPRSLHLLSNEGYLVLGTAANGRRYGRIVHFNAHQTISKPKASKIKGLEIVWDVSGTCPGTIPDASTEEQGTGNREQGTGNGEGGGAHTPAVLASSAWSRTVPTDWFPGEVLPGQVRIQPGVDLEIELLNFRAHTFATAKAPSQLQGEWIKWLNNARPRSRPAGASNRSDQTTDALRGFLNE